MVNTAFVNYLGQIDNLTKLHELPILKNMTIFEQTLPISLNISKFDTSLLTVSKTLKEFIHQYKCKKEIFDLEQRHDNTEKMSPDKNFFSDNFLVDIFLFITAIISLLVTTLVIYLLCKHEKLRTLVASLALQQVREVGTTTTQEDVTESCSCKILFYIVLALNISILGLLSFAVLHIRKLGLCRGQLFSNIVKIMLFISSVQFYVHIKLCKLAGSIHLFKITGMLKPENVKLKQINIWDVIEIDWKEVNMTFNSNKISLPKSIIIKFWDKFKIRKWWRENQYSFISCWDKASTGSHWLPAILQQKLYKST